jgi:hypothetical protein
MVVRSFGNALAGFKDIFGKTGNRASKEYVLPPFSATGGNVSALAPGNGYKYHTFTSPGTFTVSTVGTPATVEVLIVAGGGGGGNRWGGGGGAGGLIYGATIPVTATSYPISIGTGGGGATGGSTGFNSQTDGSPSSAFGYTALGGGYGGSGDSGSSNSGGSGGGATGRNPYSGSSATQPSQTPTSNIVQYGNAGGDTPGGGGSTTTGGGGGGAGTSGTIGGSGGNGRGGDGRQYPQFTGPLIGVPSLAPLSGYFAGGGAGGTSNAPGGLGGGGGGGTPNGTPGTTNSGGGGQSGTYNGPNGVGGDGGSGIVIIRYLA